MTTKLDYEAAKLDYEAAARIARELTSLLPVQFEGSHDATLWAVNIVDAALGGDPVAFAVAALIAEGGETIWWCEQHDSAGTKTRCEFAVLPMMNPAVADYCRMVECLRFPIPVESAEAKETP